MRAAWRRSSGGQGGEHLGLGGGQDGAQAKVGQGGGGAGEEERGGFLGGQTVQAGAPAVEEADTAVGPGFGPQGYTGLLEGGDVPVDGADRHLEGLGEFGGGGAAPLLEGEQQGHQSSGTHMGMLVPDC